MKKTIDRQVIVVILLVLCIIAVNAVTVFTIVNYTSKAQSSDTTNDVDGVSEKETQVIREYPSDVYTFGAPDRIVIKYKDKSVTLEKGSDDYEVLLLQNESRKSEYYHDYDDGRKYFTFNVDDYGDRTPLEVIEKFGKLFDFISVEYVFEDTFTLTGDIRRFLYDEEGNIITEGNRTSEVKTENIPVDSMTFYIDRNNPLDACSMYMILKNKNSTQLLDGLKHSDAMLKKLEEVLGFQAEK